MQDIFKITDEIDLKAKQNATQILIDLFKFLDLKTKNSITEKLMFYNFYDI